MKLGKWTRMIVAGSSATLMLGLAACSSGGGSANGGGDPVEYGASADEWAAAFEDVDEIEIRTQSSAPKGSPSGADWEAFMAEVTEASGGKITFDVGYANAYAPPTEAFMALTDGRLDLAQLVPQYAAQDFPITNALVGAGVLSDQSIIEGTVSGNVWPLAAAFETGVDDEFSDYGIHMLVPYYNTGAGALFCRDQVTGLDDLKGLVVAASGAIQSEQLKALGATTTSITYPEFYESLQRGAVDCAQTTATAGLLASLDEVAPHVVIDDEGFVPGAGAIGFSEDVWSDLPLPAQQLIWDKLATFVGSNPEKVWGNYSALAGRVAEHDGSIASFDDDAREALASARESIWADIVDEQGDDFGTNVEAAVEKWQKAVTKAGLTNDVDFSGIGEWAQGDGPQKAHDFIVDTVFPDIYVPHRPE